MFGVWLWSVTIQTQVLWKSVLEFSVKHQKGSYLFTPMDVSAKRLSVSGGFGPWPPNEGLYPRTPLGASPLDPRYRLVRTYAFGAWQQPIVFVWSRDGHSEHTVPEATQICRHQSLRTAHYPTQLVWRTMFFTRRTQSLEWIAYRSRASGFNGPQCVQTRAEDISVWTCVY